jgi:hypothetical protein
VQADAPDGRRDPRARPGEPVLFVGPGPYFRSAWWDAVEDGWGIAHPVRVTKKGHMDAVPAAARGAGARTCVVFDAGNLDRFADVAPALADDEVRLVAFSTEPVPHARDRTHPDTLRRLDNLRRAAAVPFDLWIHFDPSSEAFLKAEGFSPLVTHPIPVSERLFRPEAVPRDFDVCFLGWSTPHREAFLRPLEGRFDVVHVAHGLFDEEACRLMNRSRVVLNLHAHEFPNFENRCVQALFCGRPLVSEELSGGHLVPGRDYLLARTPREAIERVKEAIDGGRPPRAAFDRSRFLASSLRELLASTRVPGTA